MPMSCIVCYSGASAVGVRAQLAANCCGQEMVPASLSLSSPRPQYSSLRGLMLTGAATDLLSMSLYRCQT